ncbi:DNA polymerase/3'-5' exonuclease PolX [Herminiimonas sp. CN]|uniref:DNA polymerase/3'-5' exonuclease PolX n=1 Tax=Herminiimonas sp. CN TaxID=1349818 RepID=UPI0004734C94|nr:DNA polymerase/3'-5' exonuclease PolX [Herminiimonas sp. CN]
MPLHNADIAAIFDEIADLLEIRDDNPFRIRAYRNAARTVGGCGRELTSLIDTGSALPKLPGIGPDLSAKIREIATIGHCALLDALRKQMPPAITELLKVPGLGPKRVQALNRALGVSTLAQLDAAAHAGQIHDVPGFGLKTEQHILDALGTLAAHAGQAARMQRPLAARYAEALVAYLQRVPGVERVVVAGSYRRLKDTVGDLDILVTAAAGSPLMARFIAHDEVQSVLAQGETRSSVVLRNGLQVDLRLVSAESYGAALHYFTGSKAHNIAIRRIAQELGLKINEYGVFRGAQHIAGATEESVFAAVGLPFIVPELREDRGEIQAARAGRLPQLITLADLRGDLHVHTKASDGRNTIEDMARAAREQGLEYIAITDHSRHLTVAHGLDPQQLLRQIDAIDRFNATASGITVLKGIEVDILDDGTLDLPDSVLQQLDVVIAAVHSKLELPRQRQTERLLRALDQRYVNILAHPTGRLLGLREPSELDMLRIMRRAHSRHIALELNAQPERLDLDDTLCQMAREEGVLVSINSDAHGTSDFAHLEYGIGQARRGWLERGNVLNSRDLKTLRTLLSANP